MPSECKELLTLSLTGGDEIQIIKSCYQQNNISNGTTDCNKILTDTRTNCLDSGGTTNECKELLALDFQNGTSDVKVNNCTSLPNYEGCQLILSNFTTDCQS